MGRSIGAMRDRLRLFCVTTPHAWEEGAEAS